MDTDVLIVRMGGKLHKRKAGLTRVKMTQLLNVTQYNINVAEK